MSTPRLFLSLACALAGAAAVRAADEPAPEAVQKYELKNRSVFNLTEGTRPPFWPIGWVKRSAIGTPVQTPTGPKLILEEKSFLVTSILTGNPPLAVINGRSYSEGEFVRLPKKSAPVKVRVLRIFDGYVQLQAEDQILSPKLRREVIQPKDTGKDQLIDEAE